MGDALGGFYEFRAPTPDVSRQRRIPEVTWRYTDDTNMALSIYEILRLHGAIDQGQLATSFARHFDARRGYGMGARTLLIRLLAGADWRETSRGMFGGSGSYGNGGAMRVAPLGAYFADDLEQAAEQARLSAEITHAHPEGVAGAVAVAVAAGVAWGFQGAETPSLATFLDAVLPHVPDSAVRDGLLKARDLPGDCSVIDAVHALGNGGDVSAQDTAPFALWCAGRHLDDYQGAIWTCIGAGGDVDTLCAIAGGIVVCCAGVEAIPAAWIAHREPLPAWALEDKQQK